jgi:hypothetical protein
MPLPVAIYGRPDDPILHKLKWETGVICGRDS